MKLDSADRVDLQTKRQGLETLDCKLIRAQSLHMFCLKAASGRVLSLGPKLAWRESCFGPCCSASRSPSDRSVCQTKILMIGTVVRYLGAACDHTPARNLITTLGRV